MAVILDGITLSIDLIWLDEYGFSHVTQTVKKSLTGALIVQEAIQAKGRKIALKGGQDAAWIDKATADLLQAKVDTVDLTMTLVWHGVSYNVMFDRSGNISPVSLKEIYELADPDVDHVYAITILKLFEV